jgi:LPXTG-site transpeptidase (sortase) family protein
MSQDLLVLPKFDIKAPIWIVESESKKDIYAKLKNGVVVYPTTSLPGGEYSIILGHSSRYPWEPGKYKAVFSLLNELVIGDRIYVFWKQKPLVYEVVDKKIFLPYPKGEGYTENIFSPNSSEKTLILQSCWPVGVDYKRIAVKTKLINW